MGSELVDAAEMVFGAYWLKTRMGNGDYYFPGPMADTMLCWIATLAGVRP